MDKMRMEENELSLGLYDGQRIAVKCWGPENGSLKILALHGWLDNLNSFQKLAPFVCNSINNNINNISLRFVAMDFSGHGLSSHRNSLSEYQPIERTIEVLAVLDALNWKSCVLIGHSFGATIASIVAGSFPERVNGLVLLEGFPRSGNCGPEHIRNLFQERKRLVRRQRRTYKTYDDLFDRYMLGKTLLPQSAHVLLKRGVQEVLVGTDGNGGFEQGLCFSHDPKVINRPNRFSSQDINSFLLNTTCPILLLIAKKSPYWTPSSLEDIQRKFKTVQLVQVDGAHHVHLDSPTEVGNEIVKYLEKVPQNEVPKSRL